MRATHSLAGRRLARCEDSVTEPLRKRRGGHEIRVMGVEASLPHFLNALPLARHAAHYAGALHRGQRRESDEAPFILHPFEVAFLLDNAGYPDAVIAAGVLHEALEDGGASVADIRAHFGAEVAELVDALSEDPEIEPFAERK